MHANFFVENVMLRQPNVAIIGCGYWGKNLVRNFHKLKSLYAICDDNPETAESMSKQFHIPYLTFDEILQNKKIDGVVIAVHAVEHYALAKKALLANKHVYVEKPLSLKLSHAKELCELARTKNLRLMVGHLLQYHPAFLKLKEIVQNGDLGRLQYIYSNRLNLGKIRREENILWSFAPHDISMILSLAGEMPTDVKAISATHLHKTVADITTTHLTFSTGLAAHIFVSWLHPFKEQKLVIVGEKGMAVFNDEHSWNEKLQLYPHKIEWVGGVPSPSKAEVEYIPIKPDEPLTLECQHFLDCIQTGETPRTDGEEGVRVLEVLYKADQSMKATETNIIPLQKDIFIHESAYIDQPVEIGIGTKIWHFSHILGQTKIGKNCIISQNVMIGPNVDIGNNCKIQNNVSLYEGVVLEDGVFCGPSCVFTNVNTPRAEIERKDDFLETRVKKGATIGANATIVCGNIIGAYALIGAGSVITKDVPDHALMVGIPAHQIGWVSHAGEKLGNDLICPREGRQYKIEKHQLIEIQKVQKLHKAG
jgi:UDP-2-acetamido-3-amino-2,3-dideoxy-glucuronate N-acetyltransferase